MKTAVTQVIEVEEHLDSYYARMEASFQEGGYSRISFWKASNSKLSDLDFLLKSRNSLDKLIEKMKNKKSFSEPKKKWWEFWK